MYAKLPGGKMSPAGYIVPVEIVGRNSGNYTLVTYHVDGKPGLTWTAWIHQSYLLQDSEVE